MNNFEFEHEGKKLWYSRSLACNIIVYRRTIEDEWEVLACKRGQGCEFNKGLWNIPGGFIDFNEDSIDCALRELKEETGVELKSKYDVFFNKLDTKPDGKRQTIVASHYACFVEEDTKEWKFSTEFSEPDETEEIKWVPLKDLHKYNWTHGQKELIETTFEIHRINFNSYTNSRRNEIRMHQLSPAFEDFNRKFEGMY
jgi:8-oxo-dGTP diphosphatase